MAAWLLAGLFTLLVVRRGARVARTLRTGHLAKALPGTKVVFAAVALTPETEHIIVAAELAAMRPDAWLVNVARGRHVNTNALVDALRSRSMGGQPWM